MSGKNAPEGKTHAYALKLKQGRITIPKELRAELGLGDEGWVWLEVEYSSKGSKITFSKATPHLQE